MRFVRPWQGPVLEEYLARCSTEELRVTVRDLLVEVAWMQDLFVPADQLVSNDDPDLDEAFEVAPAPLAASARVADASAAAPAVRARRSSAGQVRAAC
jgi:hypothetical protein